MITTVANVGDFGDVPDMRCCVACQNYICSDVVQPQKGYSLQDTGRKEELAVATEINPNRDRRERGDNSLFGGQGGLASCDES
jgi:hypothetical protein